MKKKTSIVKKIVDNYWITHWWESITENGRFWWHWWQAAPLISPQTETNWILRKIVISHCCVFATTWVAKCHRAIWWKIKVFAGSANHISFITDRSFAKVSTFIARINLSVIRIILLFIAIILHLIFSGSLDQVWPIGSSQKEVKAAISKVFYLVKWFKFQKGCTN